MIGWNGKNVGKTCLARKLQGKPNKDIATTLSTDGSFNQTTLKPNLTNNETGIELGMFEADGDQSISIKMWDFAGASTLSYPSLSTLQIWILFFWDYRLTIYLLLNWIDGRQVRTFTTALIRSFCRVRRFMSWFVLCLFVCLFGDLKGERKKETNKVWKGVECVGFNQFVTYQFLDQFSDCVILGSNGKRKSTNHSRCDTCQLV